MNILDDFASCSCLEFWAWELRDADGEWFFMGLVDDEDRFVFFYVVIYMGDAGAHDVGAIDDVFDGAHVDGDGFENIWVGLEEF